MAIPGDVTRQEKTHVTVVGGGIAGLYATYLIAQDCDYSVELLDLTAERLGGRITSRTIDVDGVTFAAEFGPMRFELDLQERFRQLCQHLGIDFTPFSPTGSPKILTEYEMTDVEASFESVAELHEWAVLQAFFGRERGHGTTDLPGSDDVKKALRHIRESNYAAKTANAAKQIAMDQLHWLQCYLDRRLFLSRDDNGKLVPLDRPSAERNLDELRLNHCLFGDGEYPLLRDIGLWHALSETITPGAVAKIRDSGTFYHCVVNNPSAVEWGIFWLRQASALGSLWTFDDQAPEGVWTLVERLIAKLTELQETCGNVLIRRGQEVLQIEPAKRPTEVGLRVIDRQPDAKSEEPYSLRTDHVILALPQRPLRRLSEHFPRPVTERIDSVEPLTLLKAFIVTNRPWWQPHLKAQSYAWVVPTRELHFYRGETQECPSLKNVGPGQRRQKCTCDLREDGPGMIMLYTDQPGIYYWDKLIPPDERTSLLWRTNYDFPPLDAKAEVSTKPFKLLDLLVRRLLVVPHPGLAYTINDEFPKAAERLREKSKPGKSEKIKTLLERLERSHGHLLGLSQSIVASWQELSKPEKTIVQEILDESLDMLPKDWIQCLQTAVRIRKKGITRGEVAEAASDVVAYGIRDWSAEPFGGAAHLWKPGFSFVPVSESGVRVEDPLFAFSLKERAGAPKNVHICGEAFSGNQGFIEGALETAEEVVCQILGEDRFKNALGAALAPEDRKQARGFVEQHRKDLAAVWQRRYNSIAMKPS